MSGLCRRIPSIVAAVLFTLVAIEAHAGSYLFRLTEQEIDETIETAGRVFVKFIGFDPVPFDVSNSQDDVKSVSATHGAGGITIVTIPFVEGCGGVQNNGALQACTCAGTLPFGF